MTTASSIRPPWIEYPDSEPTWSGWRQGGSERWLLNAWLPFWKNLDDDGRKAYLKQNPPPDDEWNFYLLNMWK